MRDVQTKNDFSVEMNKFNISYIQFCSRVNKNKITKTRECAPLM